MNIRENKKYLLQNFPKCFENFAEMLGINYVNNPRVISAQTQMTAINSAIELDLTGQICTDSLGCKMYCGVGGQLDFGRGASISHDGKGKSIVALPSVTSKGHSRIQAILTSGILNHSEFISIQ